MSGKPELPSPAPAAEPFGWVMTEGPVQLFSRTKPDSLVNRWVPVWDAPPPVAKAAEPVGRLSIEHFRGSRAMENVDFEYTGQLEPGTYHVYTAPPPVEASQQQASERLWELSFQAGECERTQIVVLIEDAAAELSRLTAERDALKAEAEAVRGAFVDTAKALGCEPDNEAILASIEALRKDAERYRWLRDSLAPAGYADTDKLDARVDAAIAAQQRSENRNEGEKR